MRMHVCYFSKFVFEQKNIPMATEHYLHSPFTLGGEVMWLLSPIPNPHWNPDTCYPLSSILLSQKMLLKMEKKKPSMSRILLLHGLFTNNHLFGYDISLVRSIE